MKSGSQLPHFLSYSQGERSLVSWAAIKGVTQSPVLPSHEGPPHMGATTFWDWLNFGGLSKENSSRETKHHCCSLCHPSSNQAQPCLASKLRHIQGGVAIDLLLFPKEVSWGSEGATFPPGNQLWGERDIHCRGNYSIHYSREKMTFQFLRLFK